MQARLTSTLEHLKLAKIVGTRKTEGVKCPGKGANIYEFGPIEAGTAISLLLAKLTNP